MTVQNKTIKIPQPAYKLTKMLTTLRCDHLDEDYDDDDRNVFEYGTADALGLATRPTEIDDNQDDQGDPDDYDETWAYEDDNATVPTGHSMSLPPPMGSASAAPSTPDWEHDSDWVDACVTHVIPPPAESSNGATLALQRELNAMLKEQKSARSLRDLGWYISPDRVGDNLYQWIVELHSFDENLPIAVDMKAK